MSFEVSPQTINIHEHSTNIRLTFSPGPSGGAFDPSHPRRTHRTAHHCRGVRAMSGKEGSSPGAWVVASAADQTPARAAQ